MDHRRICILEKWHLQDLQIAAVKQDQHASSQIFARPRPPVRRRPKTKPAPKVEPDQVEEAPEPRVVSPDWRRQQQRASERLSTPRPATPQSPDSPRHTSQREWSTFLLRQSRSATERSKKPPSEGATRRRAADGRRIQQLYEDSIKHRTAESEPDAAPGSDARWSNSSHLLLPKPPPETRAALDLTETRELRLSPKSQALAMRREPFMERSKRDFPDFLHDFRVSQREMNARAKHYEEQEDRA
jgi:hypothetical protein